MIKTITKCPVCTSEVTVEGDVTHYYKPLEKLEVKDIYKQFMKSEEDYNLNTFLTYLIVNNYKLTK